MTFFYNLNKKLAGIADKPEQTQLNESAVAETSYSAKAARAGKDIGKPGKTFAKIAKSAGERYGSKERGEKVAGAVLAKLRAKEDVEEGFVDTVKQGAQSALQAIGSTLGHGSDEDMIKDLQKKAGVPVTGKVQPAQPGQQPQGQKPTPMAEEGGEPMTAKQKAFAKLAPPTDKITFADKIAGAKKEVDEMLGDVAAEAMKNALRGTQTVADEGNAFTAKLKATPKGGKFKMGDKEYTDTSNVDEGWDDMMKSVKARRDSKVGDVEHGAKHDIEHTATGRKVTRRVDDKGISVGADDDKPADGEKRGRGRPKKTDKAPERVTAKAYKHKGGRKMSKEEIEEAIAALEGHGYAVSKLNELSPDTIASYQKKAYPQAATTGAKSDQRAAGVARSLSRPTSEGELDEKAVSVAQRRAAGIAHAAQKGEIPKSKLKGASKEMAKMPKGELHKFAATKEKGLPNKKEKTEESGTVAGSVAPAEGGKGKSKGVVGKGIYDSLNRKLEDMIAESMNVSVNMSMDEHGEPHKNITVSAEGEAAEQLAQLLNLAGMSAQEHSHDDVCPECGSADCGCDEMVDENAPDWPTDPETTGGDDPHMTRWSGGLNKPKETGQTTVPVVNRDPRRGSFGPAEHAVDVKEEKDLGMKLYAELKGFKG